MPLYSASLLEGFATAVFAALGAPQDIASEVAASLVLSNLCGHDSHGVIRIPSYAGMVEDGTIDPMGRPSILRETETTAVVDGNWAFGQVVAHYAAQLGIEKARRTHVAVVSGIRSGHTGRLGEYTEAAARAGMVAMLVNSAFDGGIVAPYGGAERILTTNPISFAVPAGQGEPVVADIATAAVAEGKLQVARATATPVPQGAILDREGRPSTDARDFYDGGVILPFGGHKGYVISTIVDLIGKHLAGAERELKPSMTHGFTMVVFEVEPFRALAEFESLVDERVAAIRRAMPDAAHEEVLAPGDPERRARAERVETGIELPEETVRALREVGARLGVAMS